MYAGANLRAGVGVVINLVSRSLLQHMNVTAIHFAPGIDELQAAGLAVAASRQVAPPRIADSPVSMECWVRQVLDVATHRHIVVADVLSIHVRSEEHKSELQSLMRSSYADFYLRNKQTTRMPQR